MRSGVLRRSASLVGLALTVACGPCDQAERERYAAMALSDQQDAFKAASPKNSASAGRRTQTLECVLSAVKADQLSRFKFDLEYDGDYKDMVEYLFHDIDNRWRQGRVVEKLREARPPGAPASGIKVLTDVDDTMYPNLIDKRYKKKTPYPGVLAFYDALKSEPAGIAASLVRDGVTYVPVTTLSARPNPIAGELEERSLQSLIKLTALKVSSSQQRTLKPSALSGSTHSAIWGTIESLWRDHTQRDPNPGEKPLDVLHDGLTWLDRRLPRPHDQEDKIGRVKAANFGEFARAYPEYRYVFVGDSGQADALTAELLLTEAAEPARSEVVTTFIHELRTLDNAAPRTSHAFDKAPSNLLVKDSSANGRGIVVFRNYIHAAVVAYKHRATLGDLVTADELANVTEAALVEFQDQVTEIQGSAVGSLRRQYAENAREAEQLLIAASSDRAGGIRRLLDTEPWRVAP